MENINKIRNYGIEYSTVMAVNKLNHRYVKEYLEITMNVEATHASLIPVMPSGRALSNRIYIDAQNYLEVLKIADHFSKIHSYPISLWCTPYAPLIVNSRFIRSSFCRTSSVVDISPSGDLLLCDVMDISITSIKNRKLTEALEEYQRDERVKVLINPPKLPSPCNSCPLRNLCRGGCFARASIIYGDVNAGDPLCPRVVKYYNEKQSL